jgi:hypothetical protein
MIAGYVEATARVTECLGRRRVSGRRSTALVLGNGVHVQAYGELDPPRTDPWTVAMKKLVSEFDLSNRRRLLKIPRGHQVLYDELRALRSSEWVRRRISEELGSPGGWTQAPLYSDLKRAEFEVIMDLSVCGTLQKGLKAANLTSASGTSSAPHLWSDGRTRCMTSTGPTDVWQLYGSLTEPGGIRLGLFEQAAAIAELEWIRIQLMNSWPLDGGRLLSPGRFLEMERSWNLGFYRDMMLRPLVIVGTGIDLSDWSTWWLLHQRARLFSVFRPSDRPPTLVLTSRTEPQYHLADDPAGISTLEFQDFGALWGALREAFRS